MNTKEFELLLNNTVIPSNLEIDEQGIRIERLQSYINTLVRNREGIVMILLVDSKYGKMMIQ